MELKTKVRIKQTDGICSKVFIDDKEINGVQEVSYHHKAGQIANVVLKLISQVDIEEETDVVICGTDVSAESE